MHWVITRNKQVVVLNQIKYFHTNFRFQTRVSSLNDQPKKRSIFMEIKVQKLTTLMIISDHHKNVNRAPIIIIIFQMGKLSIKKIKYLVHSYKNSYKAKIQTQVRGFVWGGGERQAWYRVEETLEHILLSLFPSVWLNFQSVQWKQLPHNEIQR